MTAKTLEHRGHTLDYMANCDTWHVRGMSFDAIKPGSLAEVLERIDTWEREKKRLSGVKVWDVSRGNPKHWFLADVVARRREVPPAYEFMKREPPVLLCIGGSRDPDNLWPLEAGDCVPDSEEARQRIEHVRELYEKALEANQAFLDAKLKTLPRMTADAIKALPER